MKLELRNCLIRLSSHKCIADINTIQYDGYRKRNIISMKGAVIMAKSASVYARIDPVLKEQAETILSALGIPTSNAIDMFFKQIVLQKGLPFEVRLPYEKPVCMGALSEEELNAELEKGYADILAGRTKPAKQAFSEMRKDFNI